MGVSPVSDASLGIENGVYLRMGTHVSDPAVVDEASHFPSVYSGGLAASDGIFITTAGSYIVQATGSATIEIGGSLTQKTRDGNCDTTVDDGDVSIAMDKKGFSLKAKNNASFLVQSDHVDGIYIEAPDGKVSSKGDAIYNHTFGAYLKQVVGSTKKIIEKESTNVSVSWVIPLYLTAAISAKVCSMSLKVADASATDLKISSGGAKLGFVFLSNNVITHDMGYSVIYFKMRGIQLEYAAAKNDLSGWKNVFNVASMKTALAKSNYTSSVEAHLGIESKMPGA
jgi:hypothetical protein